MRSGLFVEAAEGRLFLDEVGDMPLALQARLLRVVQDSDVRAVGADESRTVDVRLIAPLIATWTRPSLTAHSARAR